jgi:hypothetical protein
MPVPELRAQRSLPTHGLVISRFARSHMADSLVHLGAPGRSALRLQCKIAPPVMNFSPGFPLRVGSEKKTGRFGRRGGRSWEGASCAEEPTNHPTVIQPSRVRLNSRRRYGNPYRKSHRSMPISVYSLDGSIYLRCCHLTTLDRRDHVRIRNTRHVISHLSDRLARSESMSTTRGSFVQFLLRKGD